MTTTETITRTAILTGETYPIRSTLKDDGWAWNPSSKSWSKQTKCQTAAEVFARLRTIMGGRSAAGCRCEIK